MAENFTVEKEGKKYVYRTASVIDSRTNRKRTVTEYVGRIDPETGELIEKKPRIRAQETTSAPVAKGFRHYGACHALVSVAESCGLREDLYASYGRDGDCILAVSIALILSGGPMYHLEPELESDMALGLLGIDPS